MRYFYVTDAAWLPEDRHSVMEITEGEFLSRKYNNQIGGYYVVVRAQSVENSPVLRKHGFKNSVQKAA